jgi:hypothetical protein
VEKQKDGYNRFVFNAEDSRAIQNEFRDPKTMVALQQFLAALKYLQTLAHDTAHGTTNRLDS